MFHTLRHPDFELTHQFLWVILHVCQHFLYGLAVEYLVDVVFPVFDGDMHGIGVAEKVVHVTENLLISTHQEHAQIVGVVFPQRVDGQEMRDVPVGDEVGYLSVGVASDVLQCGTACGTLVQPLYRNDGEELVNGP